MKQEFKIGETITFRAYLSAAPIKSKIKNASIIDGICFYDVVDTCGRNISARTIVESIYYSPTDDRI